MGFLSGAYGKLMAGKLVRDLQYQMTSVQSRLRRVTREIGQKEKMYQAQERNMKQALQYQMTNMQQGFASTYANALMEKGGDANILAAKQLMMLSSMSSSAMMGGSFGDMAGNPMALGTISQSVSMMYSQIQQQAQMQYTQANTLWTNMFEMQREADLQALKDLEEDLQTEKDNLESRIKIADQEYQAKKEEEKQGAQNLKPDYTGQG